jgi:chain length determinant protein tyrosine kinase EpsG
MAAFMNSSPSMAPIGGETFSESATTEVRDRAIGDIIRQLNHLSADQIEQILDVQRARGLKFGEAAVSLGLAKEEDVLWALAQQFHYAYSPESRKQLNTELVSAIDPFTEKAEAFRGIRSQLIMRLFGSSEPRRAVAVVSPDIGDGKTYFAANLAIAFSQLGGRTLLIDADMRNPRMHKIFGIGDVSSGLSSVLSGRDAGNVIRSVKDLPSLYVLPVGTLPPNPLELVERPAFGLLIRELLGKFDHVIVDTPAASYGADCVVIANRCGAALTVARKNQSRFQNLQGLVAALSMANVKQAGVAINEHA